MRPSPSSHDKENVSPFIEMSWLYDHLEAPEVVTIDVRFALNDPSYGWEAYRKGHIPGAFYMDLEKDLSAPPHADQGHGGRHPLPKVEDFVQRLGERRISPAHTVIVYDDHAGGFAARLWWMLKAIGHDNVFILNQGYSAWERLGYPIEMGEVHLDRHLRNGGDHSRTHLDTEGEKAVGDDYGRRLALGQSFAYTHMPIAHVQMVREVALTKERLALIVDAREEKRYLGEVEPIDPVAGHIPGAINIFYQSLLSPDTKVLGDKDYLKKVLWTRLPVTFQDRSTELPIICYCGSGVTSAALVAAFHALGYRHVYLYPGSYSDWVSYSEHPIARALHISGSMPIE
ncbi:MAG: sulfurtransferase [Candidatus Carbobacillus sp.]|nr:sulfurtransferase [Candidatus Carbobacillus sp.]